MSNPAGVFPAGFDVSDRPHWWSLSCSTLRRIWPSEALQVDLSVYRFGAARVLHGLDLYSVGYTGKPDELLFIYPPFAALFFIPLTSTRSTSSRCSRSAPC